MFLRGLNQDQKEMFLALAGEAMNANGIVEEAEKCLLSAYAEEMGIAVSSKRVMPLDELLVMLKQKSNKKELNQIMFELVGMVDVDSEIDKDEMMFVQKVSNAFEIETESVHAMIKCVEEYKELIKKINLLMFE